MSTDRLRHPSAASGPPAERVETVTINGLRYLVATLTDADVDRIARRVAQYLRAADQARVDADLAAEHARQVPFEAIAAEARRIEEAAKRPEPEALVPDQFEP